MEVNCIESKVSDPELQNLKIKLKKKNLWCVIFIWSVNIYTLYILLNILIFLTAEADMIMQNESDLLEWPNGLPTVSSIDEARVNIEIQKKLHPTSL